jgi:hypothetical protein
MDDTEKIVLYFFLHKRESARAREIQKWTRFSDNRILAAFMRCENTVFLLDKNPDNGHDLEVTLIRGPETDRILKKYGDLVGMNKVQKQERGSDGLP